MDNSFDTMPAAVANVQRLGLADINQAPATTFEYQDDELMITDDIREFPSIAALKVDFNFAVLCTKGRMQTEVGGKLVTVNENQVIVCRSNTVLSNLMASPDIQCRALCVTDRIVKEILLSHISLWNKTLYPNQYVILDVDDSYLLTLDSLSKVFNNIDSPFRRDILICLLRADFLMLCEQLLMKVEDSRQDAGQSRMETLFRRFLDSIARRQVKKVPVAEYAAELCITPKYLSTICRKLSGKSPMQWISEYVLEEVVYYLRNTDISVKELAHRLGFENHSHFGKFVKAHLGVSPQAYRKAASAGS